MKDNTEKEKTLEEEREIFIDNILRKSFPEDCLYIFPSMYPYIEKSMNEYHTRKMEEWKEKVKKELENELNTWPNYGTFIRYGVRMTKLIIDSIK